MTLSEKCKVLTALADEKYVVIHILTSDDTYITRLLDPNDESVNLQKLIIDMDSYESAHNFGVVNVFDDIDDVKFWCRANDVDCNDLGIDNPYDLDDIY